MNAMHLPTRFATCFGLTAATALLMAVSLSAPARAQDDTRKSQERICAHDVSRHCRKVMNSGDDAVHQCLLQNREKISPGCRKLIGG